MSDKVLKEFIQTIIVEDTAIDKANVSRDLDEQLFKIMMNVDAIAYTQFKKDFRTNYAKQLNKVDQDDLNYTFDMLDRTFGTIRRMKTLVPNLTQFLKTDDSQQRINVDVTTLDNNEQGEVIKQIREMIVTSFTSFNKIVSEMLADNIEAKKGRWEV